MPAIIRFGSFRGGTESARGSGEHFWGVARPWERQVENLEG